MKIIIIVAAGLVAMLSVPLPLICRVRSHRRRRRRRSAIRPRRRCGPHGYEATREAAMAAFAKSWRREHSTVALTTDRYSHLFPRGDDGANLAAAEKLLLA
jgi:hypothetical protein